MPDLTFELVDAVIEVTIDAGQGPSGPTGPAGTATPAYAFSYGDATPALIATLDAGTRVFLVELAIHTAFNGIGAAISIGTLTDVEAFLPSTRVMPALAAVYEASPNLVLGASTPVYLYITPGAGASQGSGSVSVHRN